MIISIIQPSFLPWLGYFEQMALADVFVYLDDVQYTRKDWRNRNRLKSPSGSKIVTVPVRKSDRKNTLIKDAVINYDHPWQNEIVAKINEWYRSAVYFNEIYPVIENIINKRFEYLVDLNYALNKAIMDYLDLHVPIHLSSEIPRKSDDKNMNIVDICKFHKATLLYDGKAAECFIDKELFRQNNISVIFQNYEHPCYPQLWNTFESHLSIVDLLMNCGPRSRDLLMSSPVPQILKTGRANVND